MKISRRNFIIGAFSAQVACAAGGNGRRPLVKTPLMLDTKRFAIHDGPGLRTTFFVKGCPLKCVWCHNPESIRPEAQLARFEHKCRQCATCTRDEVTCPGGALKLYGKAMSIDAIVEKALEDKAFYDRSGGGVTLSGGEPLFYWEWAAELFAAFKEAGLHTCLDTSLYAPRVAIDALLPVTDIWLPDYKGHDDAEHLRNTGVSNRIIRANLEYLAQKDAKMEVRMLMVPNVNDSPENVAAGEEWLKSLGITDIVRLEYFDYARAKYRALGLPDTLPPKI